MASQYFFFQDEIEILECKHPVHTEGHHGPHMVGREKNSKPEVSMTIGMFFSRANRKTFSSLKAIPSGLICVCKIAQAPLMMSGKEINWNSDS